MLNKGSTGASATPQRTTSRATRLVQKGLLFVALGLFAGAAAVAVKPPAPSNEPVIFQARTTLDLPHSFDSLSNSFSEPFISETRIRRGDTLAALLQRLDIRAEGLQQFLTHHEDARSIYKLYPGRAIQAALDDNNQLQWLRYHHTPSATENGRPVSRWLEVRPNGEGSYVATEDYVAAAPHIQMAEAVISSSLFGATDGAGIPDGIAMQIPEVLSSKVDFLRDLRKGDRLRVVYETYSQDGQQVGSGRLLALEFENQGTVHEALWFTDDSGKGSYYDFDGQSLQGAFLRTALKFTRISSTFGGRRHPIHGNWRSHNGVDYAAPTGTPIHATADGVVESIGNQRGYGKTIVLKHHGSYTTLYAHQSRFAKGLRKGDRVEQGQLIGYVGSTGWATGPHLHYEFRVAGKPIDPLAVDLPVARTLEPTQQKALNIEVSKYKTQLALL